MPPPPSSTESPTPWSWTYASLTEALRDRRILLRVHTSPSSPLPGQRNGPSTSGFTARNVAFRGLDPDQYASAVAGLRGDRDWAEGSYMRQIIVDHVNNRTPVTRLSSTPGANTEGRGRGRGGRTHQHRPRLRLEVDQSPWISTTGDLNWAIWYIARLLSRNRGHVHLSIINNTRRSWVSGELRISPFLNRPRAEWDNLPSVGRERYLRARSSAARAREVLFYGRIFGESVLADMTFTHHVSPGLRFSPDASADGEGM